MIVMIDMGLGNLRSVANAFRRIDLDVAVTESPAEARRADALILPGVGAFGDGMAGLAAKGLVEPIREHVLVEKKPLLGICLGMQLLAERSEELGSHEGLGLLPGRITRLRPSSPQCRVPNMGWCDLTVRKRGVLFSGFPDGKSVYFAHSYHFACGDPDDAAATFDYCGDAVVAAVERDNLFGLQFHPEKSQDAGLAVLSAFAAHVGHAGAPAGERP